jgi:hypothetical protein
MKKVSTAAAKQIRNFSRQKLTILNIEREVAERMAAAAETRTPSLPQAKRSLLGECALKGGARDGDSAREKDILQ